MIIGVQLIFLLYRYSILSRSCIDSLYRDSHSVGSDDYTVICIVGIDTHILRYLYRDSHSVGSDDYRCSMLSRVQCVLMLIY